MRLHYRWSVVPLLLLATFLAARGLDMDPLWIDEYGTIYNAAASHEGPFTFEKFWQRTAVEDFFWPPGYSLAFVGWNFMVGSTPFAGRTLSLLTGLLAVAWTYRLGSDLFSRRAGLLSSVLIGTSAYFLYFFHEMRGYVPYIMLIAMTMVGYWRAIHNRGGRWSYLLLFLGTLGLLYTNYLASVTLVALGVYHLLFVRKDRRWWWVSLTVVGAGLLFLPWFAVVIRALSFATGDAARQDFAFTPMQSVQGILFMFSNGSIALLAVFGFFSMRRGRAAGFAWFSLLAIFLLLLAVNARFGVVLEVRYLMPVWPALAVVAGYGAERLLRAHGKPAWLMVGLWGLAGIWNSLDPASIRAMHNPHWHLPWDEMAEQAAAHTDGGDALAFVLPDWTWRVYHRNVFNYYLHDVPLRRSTLMERPFNVGDDVYAEQVQTLVADDPLLWVAHTPDQPTLQLYDFRQRLAEQDYLHCATVYQSPLLHFELYGPRDADSLSEPARFGAGGITLRTLPVRVHLGRQVLQIAQMWSVAPEVHSQQYSVGLHIDTADGQLVAQSDAGLPTPGESCRWSALDVSRLPPGDYGLLAVVYDWQTGERLPASGGSAGEDDRALMAAFTIP